MTRKPGINHRLAVKVAADGYRVTRFEFVRGVRVRIVYENFENVVKRLAKKAKVRK